MQLFGIGEASFDRLFSSFVDTLAHAIEPVLVDALAAVFSHMPGHHLDGVGALGALVP